MRCARRCGNVCEWLCTCTHSRTRLDSHSLTHSLSLTHPHARAQVVKRQHDSVKLLLRLEQAEKRAQDLAAELGERDKAHAERVAALERDRDRLRCRLEEATGAPAGESGALTVLEEKEEALEKMRKAVARGQEELQEMRLRCRVLETDVERDQTVFSAQNKKIHFLSKKNQALKMENEGLSRLSMSPMVNRTPGNANALAHTPSALGAKGGGGVSKDSPTVMCEFRQKLDSLLAQHDGAEAGARKRAEDEQLLSEEELAAHAEDEEEEEVEMAPLAGASAEVESTLAEEEERRWRQELLQTEVELRDWTSALDSKEQLLLRLEREKAENEKLKMDYEVRLQAYEESVRNHEGLVEAAQRKLRQQEENQSKDQTLMAALQREHEQRVRELQQRMAKLKREEKEYAKWTTERQRDQQRINTLQTEIDKAKQSKADLLRKIKEDDNKYREWRQRHHREVQHLKRSAHKAEYTIRKLERENERFRAVLRRREEEKAAAQRLHRDVALANASVARTEKAPAAAQWADGKAGGGRAPMQVKTRSQAAAEKVDRYKMNRAKAKLKVMLEEYGQRGSMQAELARFKAENKTLKTEVQQLVAERDTLALAVERRALSAAAAAAAAAKRQSVAEAWGERGLGQAGEAAAAEEEAAAEALVQQRELLVQVSGVLEERSARG